MKILNDWRCYELQLGRYMGRSRHFVTDDRVTGPVEHIDYRTRIMLTERSGSVYELGLPSDALSEVAATLWRNWVRNTHGAEILDVTAEIQAALLAMHPTEPTVKTIVQAPLDRSRRIE